MLRPVCLLGFNRKSLVCPEAFRLCHLALGAYTEFLKATLTNAPDSPMSGSDLGMAPSFGKAS